ncbi:hypothetical protein AVEN_265617-1 [Araneus ventricosus]|uniref:Reverse transcriptase domain-containing protein n=1 Tax=Araneus ventricosus TaxID=182803 RepID=A0A4Y2SWS8_ARAVE|nr:hypothetical protein AVEN_265617-1 [Araneus ventricosus]
MRDNSATLSVYRGYDVHTLPDSERIAERRLNNLTIKALEHAEKLVDYDDVFGIGRRSQILYELPPSVQGTLYVDNLQISAQGSNICLNEWQLQNAVNKLSSWCDNYGHTLSPDKSRCLHFCRKRNLHADPVINIRSTIIPVADVIHGLAYLGEIFDRKITFLPHILHLRKKSEKSLNILKVLSNISWGADRTSLLRIYQTIILSRIDYGCMVYESARPSALRRLDTIHHSALRICCGAFRTSPVESHHL